MNGVARLQLLAYMALRSLWSHKVKSLIVGSLIGFGTLLFVLGTALLDSIEGAIERSVVHSLSGHLQVYSSEGKDDLAIFGDMTMGGADWGRIDDFAVLDGLVSPIDNVQAVVPMGINTAYMTRGSDLERTLGRMRDSVRAGRVAEARALVPKVQRQIALAKGDLSNQLAIADEKTAADLKEKLARIARTEDPAFWAELESAPMQVLEFLDTRVAPLAGEGRVMFIRYVGTDLGRFAEHFDRLKIVHGEMVPEGRRGILVNQKYADRVLKITAARLLDDLAEAREADIPIADTAELAAKARRLKTQGGAIELMLDPKDAAALASSLAEFLGVEADRGGEELDLGILLELFLTVTDQNAVARHAFFQAHIAPKIDVYPFDVGDVVTIRAWTRANALKAVNVRVWGTFVFEGLERSELTGAANLIDLVTFRELYGEMTAADRAELEAIRDEVGVEFVGRENAEDALFGGGDDVVSDALDDDDFEAVAEADLKREKRTLAVGEEFDTEMNRKGLVLNAAIMLEDGERIEETRAAIEAAAAAKGLKLKVVDWQEASGVLGQLALVVRVILYIAIFIIFAVALVIINNSMLMATMERVREIGTLRAIGAQRGFVMAMFLLETLVLGFIAGGLGALAGAALVMWLGSVGIPAQNEIMVFIFSGNRLYPTVGAEHLGLGLVIIMGVSLISTWYPARTATRVEPIEAMRGAD